MVDTKGDAVNVVCWGEILWDRFPDGPRLGGAPANVAYHLGVLGRPVALISRVGDDADGRTALAALAARGVDVAPVTVDRERPTGSVEVSIDGEGQARFSLNRGGAWEHIELDGRARAAIAGAGALVYGTFCQRNDAARAALTAGLGIAPSGCLRVCDPNLRPAGVDPVVLHAALAAADVVKINEREAAQIEELFAVPDAVAWLLERGAQLVAFTRGGKGSRLHTTAGVVDDHPGYPAIGGDTVGAGDAYVAVLVHHLLAGTPLPALNDLANRYASWVCTHRGATPEVPADIAAAARG
jgi:fructokinase